MKLQISFDMTDLNKAIQIALKVENFADIFEIGTPLIYKEGINAIKTFKDKFPDKKLFADTKLVDRVEDIIILLSNSGANYISVLAGTSNSIIQNSSRIAHSLKSQIALDLVDSYSMGQSAMDAKALDVDVIIFHRPYESDQFTKTLENWETTKGNTDLPIFIAGEINKKNIDKVIELKPQGIVIGHAITKEKDPEKEAAYFKSLLLNI